MGFDGSVCSPKFTFLARFVPYFAKVHNYKDSNVLKYDHNLLSDVHFAHSLRQEANFVGANGYISRYRLASCDPV